MFLSSRVKEEAEYHENQIYLQPYLQRSPPELILSVFSGGFWCFGARFWLLSPCLWLGLGVVFAVFWRFCVPVFCLPDH